MTSYTCVPAHPWTDSLGDVSAPGVPATGPADADDGLLQRLEAVAAQVRAAASDAGRAGGVRLLLATKTVEPVRIRQVLAAGYRLIGENRAQEVVAKAPELTGMGVECHFIGHLQANKVNAVLRSVTCVQTVDSPQLARRLDDRARALGRELAVFLQVNVSGEDSKSGVTLAAVPALLGELAAMDRLRVRGYMTIGLNSGDLPAVRAGYRALAQFRDGALARGLPGAELATELSMGMSGDFAAAIAEGATMVRVGSAVFGRRSPGMPAGAAVSG